MHMQSNKRQLDRSRIIGMSAAIALNLVAIFVLSIPGGISSASKALVIEQAPLLTWAEHRIEPQQSPAPIARAEPRPAPNRIAAAEKQAAMSAAAVLPSPIIDGDATAGPALGGADGAGTATGSGSALTGTGGRLDGGTPLPGDSMLKSIDAPEPPYPSLAKRHFIEGRVYLRVFVGVDGRVASVAIALSSGHAELDNAARREVLRTWTFEPEIRHGKPVAANGIVIVNFKINQT